MHKYKIIHKYASTECVDNPEKINEFMEELYNMYTRFKRENEEKAKSRAQDESLSKPKN